MVEEKQLKFLNEKVEKVCEIFSTRKVWEVKNSETRISEANERKEDLSFLSDSGKGISIFYVTRNIKGEVHVTPDKRIKSFVVYKHSKRDSEKKEVQFVLSWLTDQLKNRL
jgi:hypothetical protein